MCDLQQREKQSVLLNSAIEHLQTSDAEVELELMLKFHKLDNAQKIANFCKAKYGIMFNSADIKQINVLLQKYHIAMKSC